MRCAVISDIHANLAALEAVLEDIGDRAERIWCLGDIVGYGPDPNECVARVQKEGIVCVAGNHDWACLGKLDLGDFNPDARWACQWTMQELNLEYKDFLDRLPMSLVLGEFTLVHGSPRAPIWEYITQPDIARESFAYFDTRVCLVGHTHVPLSFHLPAEDAFVCERRWLSSRTRLRLDKGRWILNPGGLGQPRDGDPSAPYILLDTEEMSLEFRRVSYPFQETQMRMEKAGLPANLILRLGLGW